MTCRLCAAVLPEAFLDFGMMKLAGVFPGPDEVGQYGELAVAKCEGCGLIQLTRDYAPEDLYTEGYGYQSALNGSMVRHLQEVAKLARDSVKLTSEDFILDIGCNDGTLLEGFMHEPGRTLGIDPCVDPEGFPWVKGLFSKALWDEFTGGSTRFRPKIVTSIAMFYDVSDPVRFAKDVREIIHEDGVWVVEQLHAPTMIKKGMYDAICQEHLTYFGYDQMQRVADAAGFRITSTRLNDTNGGSFLCVLRPWASPVIGTPHLMQNEEADLDEFVRKVVDHPFDLLKVIDECGKVAGFGASTKGNILLQYCGLGPEKICAVADVNEEKWGKVTATGIPIDSDEAVEAMEPDAWLVLPWHFREGILRRYKGTGRKFIFPLPEVEVVVA